jgi:hypothetical protein
MRRTGPAGPPAGPGTSLPARPARAITKDSAKETHPATSMSREQHQCHSYVVIATDAQRDGGVRRACAAAEAPEECRAEQGGERGAVAGSARTVAGSAGAAAGSAGAVMNRGAWDKGTLLPI